MSAYVVSPDVISRILFALQAPHSISHHLRVLCKALPKGRWACDLVTSSDAYKAVRS